MPTPKPAAAPAPHRFLLDKLSTPCGPLLLVSDQSAALRGLYFADYEEGMLDQLRRHYPEGYQLVSSPNAGGLTSKLSSYFAGDMDTLDTIPAITRGTPFQELVWAELRRIPAGSTLSYGALATRIGRPSAVRAVGLANGSNPISIVIPCHRVIGADSSLTGYGGGLHRKRWLLDHEARHTRCAFVLTPG